MKPTTTVRQYISSGADGDINTEEVHLPGLDAHDSETLCGIAWSMAPYEEFEGVPTCRNCLKVLREIMARGYTKKQLKEWEHD